tara:strand:- start:165 stop:1235 length:1071 start_codon:yes stop_codon:yes gene_type:complete
MKKVYYYLFFLTNKFIIINFLFISTIIIFINALEISRIIDKSDANFFLLILLKIPSSISETIPFVIIISVAFLIRYLINNNELISMRNVGLSIIDVYKPIAFSIFLFGLLNLFLINPISASFEKIYENKTTEKMKNIYSIKFIENGIWIKNISINNEIIYININKIDLNSMKAEKIKILNSSIDNNKLIIAESGMLLNKELHLNNAKIYKTNNNQLINKNKLIINTNFNKDNILDSMSNYKFVPFYKYYDHIKNLKKFNIHSKEISYFYISELLKPLFLIIMGFIVLGFSGKFKRNENFFKILFISILIGFIFYLYKEIIASITSTLDLSYIFSYIITFTIPFFIGLFKVIKIEID